MNNLDEDIKIVEKLKEFMKINGFLDYYNNVDKEVQALEHLLSELETYKEIAEKLADELEFHYDYEYVCYIKADYGQCREKKENSKTCRQCILEWARKEVEKDD